MNKQTVEKAKLKSISINLMVESVEETLLYYTNLGFEVIHKSSELGHAYWAFVKKDGIQLFFQGKKSLTEEFPELESQTNGGALTLWFYVENIFVWYEQIKNKVTIIRPLGVTDYNGANEFVIMDLNGFILHFSDFNLEKALN